MAGGRRCISRLSIAPTWGIQPLGLCRAAKLSINHETLRHGVRRAETDAGQRPGLMTDERARIKQLERENGELRRANENLKAAAHFLGAELDRQSPVDRVHRCWRGLDDVEFATMTYVDWFNHRRLHGENTNDAGYATPVEAEAAYYRQTAPAIEAMTKSPEQSRDSGASVGGQAVRAHRSCGWCVSPSAQGLTHGGSVV